MADRALRLQIVERFASQQGVAVRVLPCRRTLQHTTSDAFVCDREGCATQDGYAAPKQCEQGAPACVAAEATGQSGRWTGRLSRLPFVPSYHAAASVLRWDLPVAIYSPDWCPCSDCVPISSAVGLIFAEVPYTRRAFAFSQDAFTDDIKSRPRCDYSQLARLADDRWTQLKPRKAAASAYANTRLAAMSCAGAADRFMREKGAWTCYHANWEDAFRWQREYAAALQHSGTRSRLATPTTEKRRWLCPAAAWAPYNRVPIGT